MILRGERVELRPLAPSDVAALNAMIALPGVREWWGTDPAVGSQDGFAISVDGELAGWLGWYEETDPDYRHGGLDIFLAPAFQGRGLGREALRVAARWLFSERGHHRIVIDPAAANARAIAAYAAVGFRPVGVMRRYERGPDGTWHDGLLMDLLVGELVE
ncbi:MAG TPA: GNAT family protein [Solirubrobacter sp.]|nr:GNAT family protein [Solirubrobacter sp.]